MLESLGTEILAAICISFGFLIWTRTLRYIKEKKVAEAKIKSQSEILPPTVDSAVFLKPEIENVDERIAAIEELKKSIESDINKYLLDESPTEEQQEQLRSLHNVIDELLYLKNGDVLDGRYILREHLGTGYMSVVWRAFDKKFNHDVAIKFLRAQFVKDRSVVHQLEQSCNYMADVQLTRLAAIKSRLQKLNINNETKLVYYVREYVSGLPLDKFIQNHQGKKEEILDEILKVGEDLDLLNKRGIILRRLTPSDIIVSADEESSNINLNIVDFDAVLKKKKIINRSFYQAVSEYVAPEVLYNEATQNERADVFTLGRIFCFVYYGKELPSLYQMNPTELIELLNCTPKIKKSLLQATSLLNKDRYGTVRDFLNDLRPAIHESKEKGFPFWGTVVQEESKIVKMLLHCFLGTLVFMSIARPLVAYYSGVQLSDRISVAIFHGIIGSFVWGVIIPSFFIFYLINFRRQATNWKEYGLSMLFCGIGGFLGGLLCAVPSLFVTNTFTLQCLGWITIDTNDLLLRLRSAFSTTGMVMAFPLAGLFTGMGVGFALKYLLEKAIKNQQLDNWFLPVPSKFREDRKYNELLESLTFSLATHWKVYLLLISPMLLNVILIIVLNPSTNIPANCIIEPQLTTRIIGEASVHLVGSFGLLTGFFYKMKTRQE